MAIIPKPIGSFLGSARTHIFLSTLLAGATAFGLMTEAQASAIETAAVTLAIAFFGSSWTLSVGRRDITK